MTTDFSVRMKDGTTRVIAEPSIVTEGGLYLAIYQGRTQNYAHLSREDVATLCAALCELLNATDEAEVDEAEAHLFDQEGDVWVEVSPGRFRVVCECCADPDECGAIYPLDEIASRWGIEPGEEAVPAHVFDGDGDVWVEVDGRPGFFALAGSRGRGTRLEEIERVFGIDPGERRPHEESNAKPKFKTGDKVRVTGQGGHGTVAHSHEVGSIVTVIADRDADGDYDTVAENGWTQYVNEADLEPAEYCSACAFAGEDPYACPL